jgi:molybdate transport system ATP-binding protein
MLTAQIKKEFKTGSQVSFRLDVTLSVQAGITVLFGPSGSGKTTILRSIAGIVVPDDGKIELEGIVYFDAATGTNVPIRKRRVGFVFQDYLLFPHLTAMQNVAYPVRLKTSKARRDRAMELLELLGIAYAAHRRPHQLSGGEQQRITFARALASAPATLLLDEPMSALDSATRLRLLDEVVELQRKSQIPFIYVTHNPADALRIGDSALILNAGHVLQEGKPATVFNAPRDSEVSRAVGRDNILAGKIKDHNQHEGITVVDLGGCQMVVPFNTLAKSSPVTIGIRSDDIIISRERIAKTSARNLLLGTVRQIVQDGSEVELLTSCGIDLKVRVTLQAMEDLELKPGVEVCLLIKASSCRLLP